MPTPNGTRIIINELIGYLVEKGLADAQHYAYLEDIGDSVQQVTFHGAKQVSVALRDRRYPDQTAGAPPSSPRRPGVMPISASVWRR